MLCNCDKYSTDIYISTNPLLVRKCGCRSSASEFVHVEKCQLPGCGRPVIRLRFPTANMLHRVDIYSVSQKTTPPATCGFLTFFHKRLRILNQFLHTYTFLSALDYKFLFSYLKF